MTSFLKAEATPIISYKAEPRSQGRLPPKLIGSVLYLGTETEILNLLGIYLELVTVLDYS